MVKKHIAPLLAGAILALAVVFVLPVLALPGQKWAQVDPAIHDWIMTLHAKGTGYLCCDLTDGETTQQDIRMGADGQVHWFAYVDDGWIEVPDEALVVGPNLLGRPIVWTMRYGGQVHVTCFLAGALG